MSEVATEKWDVTEDVRAFFDQSLESHEEHSAIIAGLEVVATEGIIKASRHVQEMDGCHPYEYDTSTEATSLNVSQLGVNRKWGRTFRSIRTTKGDISADEKNLENYKFFQVPSEERTPNGIEVELNELLARTPHLSFARSEQLVGYRNELLVGSKDQLKKSISLPALSEFGHAEPLLNMPLRGLSLFEQDGKKFAALHFCGSFQDVQLEPVSLDDIEFTVKPYDNQPAIVLDRAVEASSLKLSELSSEAATAVDDFNDLPDLDQYRMYPNFRRTRLSFKPISEAMVATLKGEDIISIRPVNTEEKKLFRVDKLIVDPKTQQLYVADFEAGKALSAESTVIQNTEHAERIVSMFR